MIDNLFRSLSLFALVFPVAACGGGTEAAATTPANSSQVLRFTGIPNENTTELKAKYQPLADHLTKELGVKFEYVPVANYAASVDAFKNGDILLCWFGGYTGLQAMQAVPGARVIACGKIDKEFKSYFVAHKSVGLEKKDEFPMELAGKKFTFGSESSTSGRLMPEYFIRKFAGKSPKDFTGAEMNFSGGHDKTAKLVEAGTFDAGAMDFATYDRMVKEGKLDPDLCRIVWVTPDYVDYNFQAHPKLDETLSQGFTEKLQETLVAIKDPALLAGMNRPDGLIVARNEDFDTLRKAALEAGLMR
ncbi:MAG: putative selenate ABC transporter substrate-binding protein [Planctomycetota bacterium]